MKPYAESCDQNRDPILAVLLQPLFADRTGVLEIGSGTGQHAVYFTRAMPHLRWYVSDQRENLDGISQWVTEAALGNLMGPVELDVTQPHWPALSVDAVFSANTAHIMHWPQVEALFSGTGNILPTDGLFALYGPFNYGGNYTSESNRHFDAWLQARDRHSGIRDFAALNRLAEQAGMRLQKDFAMPANNRILCWRKE